MDIIKFKGYCPFMNIMFEDVSPYYNKNNEFYYAMMDAVSLESQLPSEWIFDGQHFINHSNSVKIHMSSVGVFCDMGIVHIPIYPMQFINRHDKYGEEIYVGDKIRRIGDDKNQGFEGVVQYCDRMFAAYNDSDEFQDDVLSYIPSVIEKIGNIYTDDYE